MGVPTVEEKSLNAYRRGSRRGGEKNFDDHFVAVYLVAHATSSRRLKEQAASSILRADAHPTHIRARTHADEHPRTHTHTRVIFVPRLH